MEGNNALKQPISNSPNPMMVIDIPEQKDEPKKPTKSAVRRVWAEETK